MNANREGRGKVGKSVKAGHRLANSKRAKKDAITVLNTLRKILGVDKDEKRTGKKGINRMGRCDPARAISVPE